MKKKTLLIASAILSNVQLYAQDARGAMNTILDNYTLPIFVAIMLAGIVLGLVQQWDNIIDKDNRGTRKEGLMSLAWYVGYALLAAIVITAVKNALAGISLNL